MVKRRNNMKKEKKIQIIEKNKLLLLSLYETYLEQSGQKDIEITNSHENDHDNSGGHPDFHCNQHDNTPGKMKGLILTKNVSN